MPTALALTKQNPGCELDRAGAKGLWIGLNNSLVPHFTGQAQAA
jgi:hypothetical protein